MQRALRVFAVAALFTALAAPAGAAVRVDQDEVIFSLRAPGASEVYLVGDFNQWNPTVERMSLVDDRFEVGLFLVAGTYRYKFVVDGKWIPDPENPGPSPEKGSPLALVERSGGLILSTELAQEPVAAPSAGVGARYIGRLTDDDGNSDGMQRIDGRVEGSFDHLRAHAAVATYDSTWSGSPLSIDVFFDRGSVDLVLDKVTFRGFENDSAWASSDPMHIVGDAGVYGYDAGFRRHGVSGVAASSHVALRALLADETSRAPDAPAPSVDLAPFAAGSAPDTTAYATSTSFDGSDDVAVEATAKFGGVAFGYTHRDDRGVNPGVYVDAVRDTSVVSTTTQATREDRGVNALWLEFGAPGGVRVTGSYGWGTTVARAFGVTQSDDSLPPPATAADATTPVDARHDLGTTDRAVVEVAVGDDTRGARARWDYTRLDFDGVAGSSRASVHRVTLDGRTAWRGWAVDASVRHTDADYGATPDGVHIDWPAYNPWLSLWDAFDVADLAALGLDRYTVYSLGVGRDTGRVTGGLHGQLATRELAGSSVHASARVSVDATLRGPWYASGDARVAWYDGAVGGGGDFWTGWAEAGYRNGILQANLGFGFDPVVFNPVISDYADIGRTEFLRGALDGGFARSRSDDITRRLVDEERRLSDAAVFKVEIVVQLP